PSITFFLDRRPKRLEFTQDRIRFALYFKLPQLQERYNTIDDRMTSIQIRVLQTHPRKEPRR
ncbi:MAG TPA: hypothetical protein PLP90_05980, partial [Methanoculleus sp.]|nr:hypothetical protein [Methanoculleus sp.]